MKKNTRLQARLGYTFTDEGLLKRALSHRSVGKENNERLEFLGDSLLSVVISECLFRKFPDAREGDLSRLRASLVKGETLADIAREMDLGEYLLLGEGELKSGGFRRSSILADAVEAIIGAVYLDSDIECCRERVLSWFESRLSQISIDNTDKDPKTRLQEFLQKSRRSLPSYDVVEMSGEAHAQSFTIECSLKDEKISCQAGASSKRAAEKAAARKVLSILSGKQC